MSGGKIAAKTRLRHGSVKIALSFLKGEGNKSLVRHNAGSKGVTDGFTSEFATKQESRAPKFTQEVARENTRLPRLRRTAETP